MPRVRRLWSRYRVTSLCRRSSDHWPRRVLTRSLLSVCCHSAIICPQKPTVVSGERQKTTAGRHR